MKIFLRIAALLSFGFCFLAGLLIVGNSLGKGYADAWMVASIGFLFIGFAVFVGAILLATAERLGRKTG